MKIDDIYLNKSKTHIWYSDVDNEYMKKVENDFKKFLRKMDFEPTKTGYSFIHNAYKNESNKVIISIWVNGRSFELDVYYNEYYNEGEKYYEKKYVELYVLKCFNWIIEYNKNLEFTSDGKVRNYLKGDKEESKLTSEQKIIKNFRDSCWHKPDAKKEDFKLSDWDGTTVEDYNNRDREKKVIYNGEIKYFYSWKGYLCKGKVYHNINNMWWVICNDKLYYNVACFELFDLTEQDLKYRRKKPHILPKKYLDKISEDDPANKIRKILDSKITPRKLGQLFSEYFENRCVEQRDWKLKTTPETYYYVEGKAWSWNKVSCVYHNPKEEFEIVFRQNDYIIIMVNEIRLFELDSRILHWNKKELEKCFKKYSGLFTKIIKSVDRMHKNKEVY